MLRAACLVRRPRFEATLLSLSALPCRVTRFLGRFCVISRSLPPSSTLRLRPDLVLCAMGELCDWRLNCVVGDEARSCAAADLVDVLPAILAISCGELFSMAVVPNAA